MKKILFPVFFAACAAMSLSSCMNGDYDANPAGTASGTNPLNTGGGSGGSGSGGPGTAAKGEIRFTLNGQNVTYSGAGTNYMIIGTSDPLISGGNTTSTGTTNINIFISNYTGPGTYTFTGTSSTDNHGNYTITPFGSTGENFNTATSTPTGSGQVKVTSDANNELIGTFSFTAYSNKTPNDKVDITNGSFDVTKF